MGSDRFEKTIDHEIVFESEAQFSSEPAFDHCVFDDPQHEHFSNTGTTIFFNHAKCDKPAPFGCGSCNKGVLEARLAIQKS